MGLVASALLVAPPHAKLLAAKVAEQPNISPRTLSPPTLQPTPSRKRLGSASERMGAATTGALLALATAACSGTAAALSQSAMRRSSRPSTLFNLELALWGLPFVFWSGGSFRPSLSFRGWQVRTLAPVALQAA